MSAPSLGRATLGLLLLFLSLAAAPHALQGEAALSSTEPDFAIEPHVPAAYVYQGADPLGHVFIFIRSNAYFEGIVTLTLAVSPDLVNGPTIYLSSVGVYMIPSVTYDSVAMIGAVADTPLRSYNVTVTAVGGNLTRTTEFTVTVVPPLPPPDFAIGLFTSASVLRPGYAEGVTVGVSRLSGTGSVPVELSLDVYPRGALESSGFPNWLEVGYGWDAITYTFIVAATASAPKGTYTLNVTGTEPALSHSPTGWKPAVTHYATATITIGDGGEVWATSQVPLVYELGFRGEALPGKSIDFVSKFTNQAGYGANVTGLHLETGFGTNTTASTGLPLTLGNGEVRKLVLQVAIPPSTALGPYLVTATVVWRSSDPYFGRDGWSRSPIVLQAEIIVGATYPEDPGIGGEEGPGPPGDSLASPGGQIPDGLKPYVVLGAAVYIGLVGFTALMVIRRERARQRKLAGELC